MEIHLARDGSALGVFAESEVREGLANGRFRPTDLAWRQGMPAWTPIAEWPGFAAAGASATAAPAPVPASEIPWEQSPGLGSLFRTLGLVLIASRKLASGRFQEGSSFGLAYAAIGVGFIPLLGVALLAAFAQEGQQAALLDLIGDREGPFFEGLRTSLSEGGDGVAFGLPTAACGAVLLPLIYAFLGILEWSALRVLGCKLAFSRAVMASMSLHTLVGISLLPLSLVAGGLGLLLPLAGLGADLAVALLAFVLVAIGLGRALALNPWRIVLAWLILILLLTCCGCACAGLIGALGAAAN